MKKEYIQPSIELISIEINSVIAGSLPVESSGSTDEQYTRGYDTFFDCAGDEEKYSEDKWY